MSSPGFFEVHITTHQHGSSRIDDRALHRRMVAQGFERAIQTTAQIANEVPGVYRLHKAQLRTPQVVEMIRLALTPLGRGMAVQVMKIEEEILLNFVSSATAVPAEIKSKSAQLLSSESAVKAQSGYPSWKRPR
jgi:hypothetical protein